MLFNTSNFCPFLTVPIIFDDVFCFSLIFNTLAVTTTLDEAWATISLEESNVDPKIVEIDRDKVIKPFNNFDFIILLLYLKLIIVNIYI